MLVLSRREGEKVILDLGDGYFIEVMVVEIRSGGRIRLGFTAPDGIKIFREEISQTAIANAKEQD